MCSSLKSRLVTWRCSLKKCPYLNSQSFPYVEYSSLISLSPKLFGRNEIDCTYKPQMNIVKVVHPFIIKRETFVAFTDWDSDRKKRRIDRIRLIWTKGRFTYQLIRNDNLIQAREFQIVYQNVYIWCIIAEVILASLIYLPQTTKTRHSILNQVLSALKMVEVVFDPFPVQRIIPLQEMIRRRKKLETCGLKKNK